MNGMTPEQRNIFSAIADQRSKVGNDIFQYNTKEAQAFLYEKNPYIRSDIGPKRQYEILDQLAKMGLIKLDYVTEKQNENGSYSLVWKNNTDWAHDDVQCSEPIENLFGRGGRYINISFDEIATINTQVIRRHPAQLFFYDLSFEVQIKGENYKLQPMQDDKPPYQIIAYIMNNKKWNQVIRRDELCSVGIDVRNKSLLTQVFSDNKTITDVLKPFIEIKADYIKITPSQKLTDNEKDKIIAASI